MKNTSFMFKTEEEKTVKLITLLRQRSRDTLSGEQLNQLALAVKTGRQYTVRIHTTPSGFCESLVLVKSDTDNDVGTVVFGQALFGAATESGYREGRLFLPSSRPARSSAVNGRTEAALASATRSTSTSRPQFTRKENIQSMDKSKKRHIAYEALTLLGVVILLCFITRLWPILLLALAGAVIAAVVLLFASLRKPEAVILPPPAAPSVPDNERDLIRMAFTILERRITEAVLCEHPGARWVWETPHPEKTLHAGGELCIILNHAGGFRRAQVTVADLQFVNLSYTAAPSKEAKDDANESSEAKSQGETDTQEDVESPMPVNYELVAFEWVEDHISYLSDQCNEAIARGDDRFVIPASVLPVKESWPAVCAELEKHDFTDTEPMDDGVAIATPQVSDA